MADFPSAPGNDYPVEISLAEPEVLISRHRDGSEQRRLKGAGSKRMIRLSFGSSMPITYTQYQAILSHYAGQNGSAVAFNWTNIETAETLLCRYAERPSVQHVGYDAYTVNVTLQEVTA